MIGDNILAIQKIWGCWGRRIYEEDIGCAPSSDEGGSYRPLICEGNKSLPKSMSLSDSDPLKFLGAIFCSSEVFVVV